MTRQLLIPLILAAMWTMAGWYGYSSMVRNFAMPANPQLASGGGWNGDPDDDGFDIWSEESSEEVARKSSSRRRA